MLRSKTPTTALLAVAAACVCVSSAALGSSSDAGPLCAFRESTTRDGLRATASLHVVRDDCQLSMVSISKFAAGNEIHDFDTATLSASDVRKTLSVELPCGVGSETDVVLGPPTLYPPLDLDLGATAFDVACPAGGGGATGGGGGGGGGGSTGGGGGSTGLPDLAATVASGRQPPIHVGDVVPVTVVVRNRGAAGAAGVHAIVSLSPNAIRHGVATASRGPGCTGVTVLDCNLGGMPPGASGTVQLGVSSANSQRLFIGVQAQEAEDDAKLADNSATLALPILARPRALVLRAIPHGIVSHDELVFVSLTRAARVTAEVSLGGRAQAVAWRRSLSAGTTIVRIPLPALARGQHFVLVLRARSGTQTDSARLQLHA